MTDSKVSYPLNTATDVLQGMNTYIDGKMRRYSLLFSVNGGAFAIAKLIGEGTSVGGITLEALAVGAILFTLIMWFDINSFGTMMRDKFFGGELVFAPNRGPVILAFLCLLIIVAWLGAVLG